MRRREEPSVRDGTALQQARRRISRKASIELYDWADAAGNGMFKAFSDYRTHGDIVSLEEISSAVTALRALTDELIERHQARE